MGRYYFDHNATTPVSQLVIEPVVQAMLEVYGNASSIHQHGQAAKQLLERARRQVAELLRCAPPEIIFTSGGTEADNLALLGAATGHVVTTTIEHPAVLQACAERTRRGTSVTYVPVGSSGVVDPDDVRRALRPDTSLVAVMHANNEVGTWQPLEAIGRIAREAGAAFFSDGVQAAGKGAINVHELGVDLYSLSGHKIYGPKGIGALYVRKGHSVERILFGGQQEHGRRPGTENVAGAVGLGVAADAARQTLDLPRLATLRDRLEQQVLDRIPGAVVNCGASPRVPNTTNIRFEGVEGEPLLIALDLRGFAVSSGAACSSGAVEPSHVLTAIGLSKPQARSSIRFSLGQSNDAAQVDALVEALAASVARLRKLAPV